MKLRGSTYGFRRWIECWRIGTFSSSVAWPVIRQITSTVRAVLGGDPAVDPVGERLVVDEVGVEPGDRQVGLGQDHLGVVDQRAPERPAAVHLLQASPGRSGCSARNSSTALPEAVPAGQRVPALHPAEDPGDRAEVVDARSTCPAGRPGADLELGDLLDRRGLREVGRGTRASRRPGPGSGGAAGRRAGRGPPTRRGRAGRRRRGSWSGARRGGPARGAARRSPGWP